MELKQLIRRFAYKIEPKPEGGFIARSTDPSVPSLEAPTREELQRKIQENLIRSLGESFPALKQQFLEQLQNRKANVNIHIEHKPGGGFAVHSDESAMPGRDAVTHEKFDHFAEQLLNFVARNVPQVEQSLDAIAESTEIEVITTEQTNSSPGASAAFGAAKALLPTSPMQANELSVGSSAQGTVNSEKASRNFAVVGNTPIVPEASSLKTFFRLILAVVIIAGLVYLFLHRG